MSGYKEQVWKIGDGNFENDEFDVPNANTKITLYFRASGSDTANDTTNIYSRYFNLTRGALHIMIRPSAVITINQIKLSNGMIKTFKKPITVAITGWTSNFGAEIESLVMYTTTSNANIKVQVN